MLVSSKRLDGSEGDIAAVQVLLVPWIRDVCLFSSFGKAPARTKCQRFIDQ